MSLSTTYLLNVALHAAILSVFASLALLAMRQARHRSVTAIAGLLAVGFLPWVTALRPEQPITVPVPEIQSRGPATLPIWTVVTLSAQQQPAPAPAEPVMVPAKWVFPDATTTFATIWAAGAGLGLLLLGFATLKVRFWRNSLLPLDAATWQTLQSLAPEISARHRFRLSESTASPCVTGFFRPSIVLPRFLLESCSEEELRWAVRHEIAHWRADDSRWLILLALIRCTNWWNPFVHQLFANWSIAREQLCDFHATGVSTNRADYGEFLITMARRITQQPPLSVAMAKRLHARRLRQRIVALLGSKQNSCKPVGKGFIGIGSVLLVILSAWVSVIRIGAEEPSGISKSVLKLEITAEEIEQMPSVETSSKPPPAEPPAPRIPELPAPAGNPVGQVRISHKLLMNFARPDFKNGSVLSETEFRTYLKSQSQIKGVHLMTAPSITSRVGESGTIEIIREVLGSPEQVAARGPKSPTPFMGIKFESLADLEGNQVRFKLEARYHFIPGLPQPIKDSFPKSTRGLNPDQIKIASQSITAVLNAGETLCSDLGEIEAGKFLQVFTTLVLIDATGRPIDGFVDGKPLAEERNEEITFRGDSPVPISRVARPRPQGPLPSEEVQGKLKLFGTMVELPVGNAGSTHEDEMRRLVPSSPEEAERMRKAVGAKLRKLNNAEIPLNVIETPWPEFPGLKVSAIASSDLQLLTISSHAVGEGFEGLPNTWQDLRAGSTLLFRVRVPDPTIERNLLITIEAVK